MNNYGIRPDYKARAEPAYFLDNLGGNATWQPDVYRLALTLADALAPVQVIDVGCGNGDKLAACPYPVRSIDYGENLVRAMTKHHMRSWIEHDLECGLPALSIIHRKSVMVCSDVIEHLKNPSPLLKDLADETHLCGAVVISTPDRLRLYGHDHNGEPTNPHHAREWALDELTRYLQSLGANIRLTGYTRCNDVTNAMSTMILVGGIAEIDFGAIAKQVGIEVVAHERA